MTNAITASLAADLKESMDSLRVEIVGMEADLRDCEAAGVQPHHLIKTLAEAYNMLSDMEDRLLILTNQ